MKKSNSFEVRSAMVLAMLAVASPLALAQSGAGSGAANGSEASSGTGTDAGTGTGTGADASAGTSANAASQKLSDEQIAAVVLAADNAELNQARLAEKKTKSKQVKGFAHHMISDHGKHEHAVVSMDKQNRMTPEQSSLSQSLASQTGDTTRQLGEMSGKSFDKAYIDAQVKEHQSLLDALNHQLIPDASNPRVKEMLTRTARTVSSHLEQAKRIQASMAG